MGAIKTISSKYVIQRVFANHSINNGNWENDAMDWIGQAMRFIGKSIGFDRKICTNIKVENHRCCYPIGMEGLIAVIHNGFSLPLGTDLSGIGIKYTKRSVGLIQSNDDILKLNGYQDRMNTLQGMYAQTPTQKIADDIQQVATFILALEISMSEFSIYREGRKGQSLGESYNTKLDVIQTSFEEGWIDLLYTAFKVDEEGYLLVPDNEYYIQALEWYILLILVQKGYKHAIFDWNTLNKMFFGGVIDGRIEGGWKGKAANNLKMPSIDNLERMTRMMERYKLDRSLYSQQFRGGEQHVGLIY